MGEERSLGTWKEVPSLVKDSNSGHILFDEALGTDGKEVTRA